MEARVGCRMYYVGAIPRKAYFPHSPAPRRGISSSPGPESKTDPDRGSSQSGHPNRDFSRIEAFRHKAYSRAGASVREFSDRDVLPVGSSQSGLFADQGFSAQGIFPGRGLRFGTFRIGAYSRSRSFPIGRASQSERIPGRGLPVQIRCAADRMRLLPRG